MLISCNSHPSPLVALPRHSAGEMHHFANEISRFPELKSQVIEIRNAAWTLYLKDMTGKG